MHSRLRTPETVLVVDGLPDVLPLLVPRVRLRVDSQVHVDAVLVVGLLDVPDPAVA